MAYANWLSIDTLSGSGNGTINVSASSSNTGRNARSTTFTASAANCDDVVRTVSQAGKPEFVSISSTASVSKDGGSVTISGTSNSSKLTFSLGTGGTLDITLPTTYTANSVTTDNGVAITGDPGASAEYAFSITIADIPANTSIDDLTKQIIVTDNASHTSTCTITQAAGDAYLTVTPASVELPWDASTSGSFSVSSNTSWTIA